MLLWAWGPIFVEIKNQGVSALVGGCAPRKNLSYLRHESTYLLTLLYYTTRVHVNVHVLESSFLNGVQQQHVFIQQ